MVLQVRLFNQLLLQLRALKQRCTEKTHPSSHSKQKVEPELEPDSHYRNSLLPYQPARLNGIRRCSCILVVIFVIRRYHYQDTFFTFCKTNLFFFETHIYREERHRFFHPLVHTPNGYNSQSWAEVGNQELLLGLPNGYRGSRT